MLILWNVFALFIMRLDKQASKRGAKRVSEKSLLFIALAMGAVGIQAGMLFFRHKTMKPKFKYGVPVLIVINLAVYWAAKGL